MSQKSKSIIQTDESKCYITGASNCPLERHHVMNGSAQRKIAEQYGLVIMVTPERHRWIHGTSEGVHYAQVTLKPLAQKAFEARYSHEMWMQLFRKNYL